MMIQGRTSGSPRAALAAVALTLGAAGLAGCATDMPTGPSLVAMPRPGEPYPVFQQHDAYCRDQAVSTSGTTPQDAAANHAVGGAAIGAATGAAAGALLGSAGGAAGPGAALGAGAGLLFGGALGSDSGQAAAARIQHRYNIVYAQCMRAYGERVRWPRPYYGYPPPPPPPPYYGPPPGPY